MLSRTLRAVAAIAFIVAAFAGRPAHAASILVNGDFELAGNPPTGWKLTGSAFTTTSSSFVEHGIYGVGLDNNGVPAELSQSLTTIAGDTYDISLWLNTAPIGSTSPNYFETSFGGTQIGDVVNAAGGWKQYVYVATAATTHTVLSFDWKTGGQGTYMALDNASVVDAGRVAGSVAVPLPGTSLSATALLGLLAIGKRMTRRFAFAA